MDEPGDGLLVAVDHYAGSLRPLHWAQQEAVALGTGVPLLPPPGDAPRSRRPAGAGGRCFTGGGAARAGRAQGMATAKA